MVSGQASTINSELIVAADTRREHVARAIDPDAFVTHPDAHDPRTVLDQQHWRRRALEAADRVLAALPALPVADEAEISARALDEAAGALRTDETALPGSWKAIYNAVYASWLVERATALRGADRG